MRISWRGDSLIEAYEAHNPRLTDPADLPPVGSMVEITQWRHRGFSHAVTTALQARYPSVDVESVNFAVGGATSADVFTEVSARDTGQGWHIAVVSCGTNDVWRSFQQRPEGVPIGVYEANIRAALHALATRGHRGPADRVAVRHRHRRGQRRTRPIQRTRPPRRPRGRGVLHRRAGSVHGDSNGVGVGSRRSGGCWGVGHAVVCRRSAPIGFR
ncbi:SGNH/GDSL hydrolase family protein [Nocardia sp. NPDC051911]|uniref:SGNH/GDSL hydrolase family protein n=1 Tax=Nocardia sp. NPDC051911 TaxID=3154648 RepID=UPI00342D7582